MNRLSFLSLSLSSDNDQNKGDLITLGRLGILSFVLPCWMQLTAYITVSRLLRSEIENFAGRIYFGQRLWSCDFGEERYIFSKFFFLEFLESLLILITLLRFLKKKSTINQITSMK